VLLGARQLSCCWHGRLPRPHRSPHDEHRAAGFHQLHHTGNQLASKSGASTKELVHRMGQGSMCAEFIGQHNTGERARAAVDRQLGYPEGTTAITARST
jgi:hypothetical protein